MLETSGPVPAFTDAVQSGDVNRIAGLLAHDVRLSIPPLHYTRHGAQDVTGAVLALFRGFTDLRYDVRSRYVAPGRVTDEATLSGRQTGRFLGTDPGRDAEPGAVAVRIMVDHDAATVTGVTVWPDLAALHALVGGTSRLIDLTRVGDADAMVASLRATIPPVQAKLIIGSSREARRVSAAPPALPEPVSASPGEPGPLSGRTVPKSPVPRAVRRRRSFLAGGAMLLLSTALTLWVVLGALRAAPSGRPATGRVQGGVPAAVAAARQTGPADERFRPPSSPSPSTGRRSNLADATPTVHLDPAANKVEFGTDLLFDFASARLKPDARHQLDALIHDAREQHRQGQVDVAGYTDDIGRDDVNLRLSRQRAAAVADVLRSALAGTGLTFRPVGYGKARSAVPNTSERNRAANRRVTITFPSGPRAATPPATATGTATPR